MSNRAPCCYLLFRGPAGHQSIPPCRTCCWPLGLGATLTTLHLLFEKETETTLGLLEGAHSYAILPIGYPMGLGHPRTGHEGRLSESLG